MYLSLLLINLGGRNEKRCYIVRNTRWTEKHVFVRQIRQWREKCVQYIRTEPWRICVTHSVIPSNYDICAYKFTKKMRICFWPRELEKVSLFHLFGDIFYICSTQKYFKSPWGFFSGFDGTANRCNKCLKFSKKEKNNIF